MERVKHHRRLGRVVQLVEASQEVGVGHGIRYMHCNDGMVRRVYIGVSRTLFEIVTNFCYVTVVEEEDWFTSIHLCRSRSA